MPLQRSKFKDLMSPRVLSAEGGEADAIEAVLYEGYGPGGVAVLVEALTDNRNRTSADIRHAFSKHGGSLGEPGSVAYLFDKKGTIVVDGTRYSEDDLMPAVEAGAEDISTDDDVFEVITSLADFAAVRAALEEVAGTGQVTLLLGSNYGSTAYTGPGTNPEPASSFAPRTASQNICT